VISECQGLTLWEAIQKQVPSLLSFPTHKFPIASFSASSQSSQSGIASTIHYVDIYKTTNANWLKAFFATSGHHQKYLISSYRADRPKN
jgi:hypothetical protein